MSVDNIGYCKLDEIEIDGRMKLYMKYWLLCYERRMNNIAEKKNPNTHKDAITIGPNY